MIKFEVTNRFTGAVQFTAEIDCADSECYSIKLGLAVKLAVRAGANLAGANLARAKGISPERSTPLLMLLDQPCKIRAYKLVDSKYRSPIQTHGKLSYAVGKTISVEDANTDPREHCAAGVNVATLDWCLTNWKDGYRILVVEFEAADIACIPTATDGKFRLHRCTVIAEKPLDLAALGLVKKEKDAA